MARNNRFDVFVCHASEDKSAIVEPLAIELRKRGLRVWLDTFELTAGDSLRESIESGLAKSRFGIVVFSESFFRKKWPKKELNGLFAKEMAGGKKKVLPVRHGVSMADITKRFPIQSDRVFLSSDLDLSKLCDELIRVIKPKLLLVNSLKTRSFESTEAFVEAARKQYSGFDFGVSFNTSDKTAGAPDKRVEIRVADPSAATTRLTMNIKFIGEGAEG